jgi:uncharacterized protein involved in exopolysaccharide biosynthesis
VSDNRPRPTREPIELAPSPLGAADLLHQVGRRWWLVLSFGLIALGAASIYYRNADRWYEAEIMVVPPASTGGSEFAMLATSLPFGLSPSHSDSARIASILESRTVSDGVIERFDLIGRYEVTSIEKARKRLWGLCSTRVEKKPKVVHLRCEDKDPAVVRDMTDAFATLADAGLRRVAALSTHEESTFLEDRLAAAERELQASTDALRRFQEEHAILDLPAQGKAVVTGLAALEGRALSTRLELAYTRTFASSREATADQLRRQIGAISAELRALEQGGATPTGSRVFPPALAIPKLRAELDALLREHQIRQTLFLGLRRRYEMIQADKGGDVSSFFIFDRARLPERHIRPGLRILPCGFLAGLLYGVLFVTRRRRGARAVPVRPI